MRMLTASLVHGKLAGDVPCAIMAGVLLAMHRRHRVSPCLRQSAATLFYWRYEWN